VSIRTVRIIWQVAFFALFAWLAIATAAESLGTLPVSGSLFLEFDPLVAIGTSLSARHLYHVGLFGLLWALLVFLATLVLGRAFCNWVCPYGATHQFIGWLTRRRRPRERMDANRYRSSFAMKYIVLAAFLVAAFLGSLQIGLLDPLCLFHRSVTTAFLPAAGLRDAATRFYLGGWVIGGLLFALLAANALVPRFFCRMLCPLGALLGLLSRFSLYRIHRDPDRCTDCGLCASRCEGACDPHGKLRKSECLVCFNCIDDCPHGALAYRFLPPSTGEVPWPEVNGRRTFLGIAAGLAFAPLARISGRSTRAFHAEAIRPPGSVEELEFLERCIKCGQCMRVCPTNTLQPAGLEAGIEGIWTPVHVMRIGACQVHCTLCGQVCPTGAIQRITIAEKTKVKIGTAFFDHGRCLPWAMDTPCTVCWEACPVSPKAIFTNEVTVTGRDGKPVILQRPQVDPTLCNGCGACEHACVVPDQRAIRVTAAGETRSQGEVEASRNRSLLLGR